VTGPMDGGLDARLAAATEIAKEAGQLAMEWWSGERALGTTFKGRHDFLTQADGAVETLIRARLAAAFPDDAFVGEEGGGAGGKRQWVVDPIDGTSNFATGVADWCISIAFVQGGVASIGVIFAPVLAELYVGCVGRGATKNGAPMRVLQSVDAGSAVLDIDWSPVIPKQKFIDLLGRVMEAGFDFRRAGSCAMALARTASGSRHGYVQLWTKPWDALAGVVLVREAGGYTSRFEEGLDSAMGNPILACVPNLAPTLVRLSGIGS